MNRRMRLYKRLLDVTLFSSLGLMIVFIMALIYGMIVNAFQFTDNTLSFVRPEHSYLLPILISLGLTTMLIMILARIIFGIIQGEERLVDASEIRKQRNKIKKKRNKRSETKEETLSFSQSEAYRRIKEETVEEKTENVEAYQAFSTNEVMDEDVEEEIAEVVETNEEVIEEVALVNQEEEDEVIDLDSFEPTNDIKPINEDKDINKEYYTRLNKGELIKIVAKTTGLSVNKSRIVVNTLLETIKEELTEHREVKIDDFGRFYTNFQEERTGINPQTKRKITVEAMHVVKFTPYKKFKEAITMEVKDTGTKYLKTKETEKDMTEDQLSDLLEEEKVAQEHVEEAVQKIVKKKEKVVVPKKTKTDVSKYINEHTHLSKNKSTKFLNLLIESIKDELILRNNVKIEGMGTFTTVLIPEKEGVNPSTGEKIIVPEHTQIRMRFEKAFKAKLNE